MSIGSEASAAGLGLASASGANITTDPQTGEIVGGLKGLRDLIRAKKESQEAGLAGNDSRESNPEVKTAKKNDKSEAFGIRADQIVYAETKRVNGRIVDVLLYVIKDDGVIYTYTPQLFGSDQQSDFCRDINRILRANNNLFNTARHEEMKMYIRKDMPITTGETALIYDNKYELMSSSDAVYQEVRTKLATPTSTEKATINKDSKQKNDKAKKTVNEKTKSTNETKDDLAQKSQPINEANTNESTKSEQKDVRNTSTVDDKKRGEIEQKSDKQVKSRKDDEGIVIKLDELRKTQAVKTESKRDDNADDKAASTVQTVLDVHKVLASANGNPSLQDVMQTILLLGRADGNVIKTLFGLDDARTAEIIDSLRRMRALGSIQSDGSYQILLKSVKQLGHDAEYMLMSSSDNFRAVVPKMSVRGRRLVYDLGELRSVQMAEEFVRVLVRFCEASPSHAIDNLFENSVERDIPVSRLLQVVSADDTESGYNTGDYSLFNDYVTRYMLAAGWMADDNGFPWLMFDIEKTDGLKNDILKYLMTNLSWIKAIYSDEVMEIMLVNLQKLDLRDCIVPEMEPLRDALCAMIANDMQHDSNDVDKSQMSLTTNSDSDGIDLTK